MIEVKNLHKSFDGKPVLKGISTRFDEGQCNLIIGSSGSGKTVFIKCLLGLFEPSAGEIMYNNRSFVGLSRKEKKTIRQEIGMVFQGGALFDSMNIEENIMFPLRMFSKMSYKEQKHRVNECLDRVNLSGVNAKFPSEISGGMQKRVAIARAIALNPRYLFCDEPNSGLDPQTAILIDNLLKDITKEYNMTTLINTHDMNSVMEIGEQIIYIKDGELRWQGMKDDLFSTKLNPDIESFVFSSELFKRIRNAQ